MNFNNEIEISLEIMHRNLGQKCWSDYEILDQEFRSSIDTDSGDLKIGKEQLEKGMRVNILAYCKGNAI